jgi:hypothetical protein
MWPRPPRRGALQRRRGHPQANQAFYEYLVPIVKGWITEMSIDVTSTGVQVHGGMGFIEETGAAQHYRDARILPIYEGTTAIQANDLVGRKTVRDGGAVAKGIIAQVRQTVAELQGDAQLQPIAARLADAADALEQVVDYVVANVKSDIKAVFAGSVPYLKMAGVVLGGWQMARAAAIRRQAQVRRGRQQVLRGQAGDRAFLRRADPAAGAGLSHGHRRWRCGGDGAGEEQF